MIKVLDTSAISAMVDDIQSVDLINILSREYQLGLTAGVCSELRPSAKERMNKLDSDCIEQYASNKDSMVLQEIINRKYFKLHTGEVDCIVNGILLSKKGAPFYIITDDKVARDSISKIINDKEIQGAIGKKSIKLEYGGCVGLFLHLYDKGLLTADQCHSIANELSVSSFRLTDELLNLLRNTRRVY